MQPGPDGTTTRTESSYERGHFGGKVRPPERVRANAFSQLIQAVVVGVSRFDDAEFKELPNCAAEADRLAQALRSENGCRLPRQNVRLVVGDELGRVRRTEVDAALRGAVAALTPHGVLVLFLASHGWEDDGRFAIAVTESVATDLETGLTIKSITSPLQNITAGGFLMITDCCGGAGIAESSQGLVQAGLDGFDFRVVLSSASRGENAWDFEDGGSAFANALINALYGHMAGMGAQGEIFLSALFDHLQHEIRADFSQRGLAQLQSPRLNSSIARDPLLFANSEASLNSIEFSRSRLTPEMARRRVRRALLAAGGTLGALVLAVYTFVDQSRFYTVDGDGRIAQYYGRSWAKPLIGNRLVWQTDLPARLVVASSSLGRSGSIGFFKGDDQVPLLLEQLTDAGRLYVAILSGENALRMSGDPDAWPPEVQIAIAETYGDTQTLLALSNAVERPVAKAAIDAFARTDPSAFLKALFNGGAYHLLDRPAMRYFVDNARAFSCTAEVAGFLNDLYFYGTPEPSVTRLRILAACEMPIETAIGHGRPRTFTALGGEVKDAVEISHFREQLDDFLILRFLTGLPGGPCAAQDIAPPRWEATERLEAHLLRASAVIDWMAHVTRLCGAELHADFESNPAGPLLTVRFEGHERQIVVGYDSSLLGSELALVTAMHERDVTRDLLTRFAALDALDNPTAINAPPQVLHALAERAHLPEVAELAETIDPWGVLPQARLIFLWRADPERALRVTLSNLSMPARADHAIVVAAALAPVGPSREAVLEAARQSPQARTRGMAEVFFGTVDDSISNLTDPDADHRAEAWEWICARSDLDEILASLDAYETDLVHGQRHHRRRLAAERSRAEAIARLDPAAIGPFIGQHLPTAAGCRVFVMRSHVAEGNLPSLWEPPGIQ